MQSHNRQPKRSRPFPWTCPNCRTETVVPSVIDYTAKVKQDGILHELHLSALEVPQCTTCKETIITTAIDAKINDALRSKLRLLSPAQMRCEIEELGLKQQELAESLGVAPETISRWLNGAMIQSRAMDNLLRLFFELEEVRSLLKREFKPQPVNRVFPAGSTPEWKHVKPENYRRVEKNYLISRN